MAHCHVNTAHRWALPRPPLLRAGLSRHPGGQTIRWYKGDEATGCGVGCTCGRDSPCCHICGVTLIEAVQRCQGQQQTLCLDWTPANSCLGLDSSVPVPGSDSPQSLLWMVDMMDLDMWAPCYNVSFVGCLAGVKRQRGSAPGQAFSEGPWSW